MAPNEQSRTTRGALVLLTVVAAPVALASETALRKLLFPPEFEEVRALLEPSLTPVGWALVGVAVVLAVAAVPLRRRLGARAVAKLPEARRADPAEVARAQTGAFMLAASVPQLPAIASTMAFMFGASVAPVLVAVAVSTVGVVLQALWGEPTRAPNP
jgi:hypothetical protein